MESRPYADLREGDWTGEALTLAEAHAHLATTDIAMDSPEVASEIASLIVAARQALEREHDVLLRETVAYTWTLDDWPCAGEWYYLPVSPMQSITSVQYVDADNNTQSLASTNYRLRKPTYGRSTIVFAEAAVFPTRKADTEITITVSAGWGVGKVPGLAKQAMRLMLSTLFDESEDVRFHELAENRARNLMRNLVHGVLS